MFVSELSEKSTQKRPTYQRQKCIKSMATLQGPTKMLDLSDIETSEFETTKFDCNVYLLY
jgi:hypothetical protein